MPSSFPGITSLRYLQTITPTSVSVECGTTTLVIVNCVEQISLPGNQEKEVWLAEINGVRRVLKSWIPDLDALWLRHVLLLGLANDLYIGLTMKLLFTIA